MRWRILCLLLALTPAAALADESPVGISYVETKDLNLYYIDSLSYLVPHAVRTFTNSLAWQRRMFGWVPSESITVLLRDATDYGNATTFAAPHSMLFFDVAPVSQAFETFPAIERMYWQMNHELVHVVQGDIASDDERRWRRFFLGKVAAQRQDPESLLYTYLTVPRFTAPRWYLEGGAVFMETWMDGGLGRAQGGYDEMVFRAMVRDDAHFYDPLGLASRGTQLDFQVGVNAYLYGTRFFTWLAYTYSPEKVIAWIRRDDGSERYWSDQFQRVFGIPVEKAWQDWVVFEHEFQRQNLAEVRKNPITPYRTLVGSAVGSVSRTYYDEATGILYGGFRYAGTVEYIGALNTRDGSVQKITDIKRAMVYRVTSLAARKRC
jgi:PAS domain-containing protein